MDRVLNAIAALRRAEVVMSEVPIAEGQDPGLIEMTKHIISSHSQSLAQSLSELFRVRKIRQTVVSADALPNVKVFRTRVVVMTVEDYEVLHDLVDHLNGRRVPLGPPVTSKTRAHVG